jgi:hypothetical protein
MKKKPSVLGLLLLISLQCSNIYAQYDKATEAQIKNWNGG